MQLHTISLQINLCAMVLSLNYLRLWFCRSNVYKSTL
ncbi:hypothetical protein IHE45_08G049500 [Dioscorea alata]|uniref:Uncharacterized protein n=1 Tax=Dioscorea alata TaxID=55571 RepID=A0ACB7VIM6_DIOAL|nr:hypothetical protein IHE45_08G049500 [Dioscorea alata]